ncbi:hypothetical protein NITMOv2_1512 [Nitrospira moscoviensis]|uniref:Uncharacterized protein n=1 Tax=Nitrospira moscoviensis TaxID=42253 RepID=A0A0K2GAH2_NITMO|nr:hypothetical protein NITMOv2_1512 [Nitrospira moscoviensis]
MLNAFRHLIGHHRHGRAGGESVHRVLNAFRHLIGHHAGGAWWVRWWRCAQRLSASHRSSHLTITDKDSL